MPALLKATLLKVEFDNTFYKFPVFSLLTSLSLILKIHLKTHYSHFLNYLLNFFIYLTFLRHLIYFKESLATSQI